ncbi:MAG: ATP-binding protein [Elusimicrobia bacterium]|nr:ATP-binding protein [Elusimicrobiota bacterium]
MKRAHYLAEIARLLKIHPVAAILGPRQCGKTTLARQFVSSGSLKPVHYFDLEDETDLARLDAPKLALEGLRGLVVIDEVQRRPALFETLRVLADRRPLPARFLILGSASRDLIHQGSESLAGRISFIELPPFTAREVPGNSLRKLWLRGGFPASFLATSAQASRQWRRDYIATFLERDIPALGFRLPAGLMRRFWMMLAHYHGQNFNASEIGRSLGLSDDTMRRYLDLLTGTFMVRQLSPWFENLGKRQVKSPKIYFRDSGLFHALLGVWSEADLRIHPKLGASWEGWALEEVIRAHDATPEESHFWATHNQAELDLLIARDGRRIGYEIKYTDAPRLTPSMRIALRDLKLDELSVIFPGDREFPLADSVRAVGFDAFLKAAETRREASAGRRRARRKT